MHLYCRALHSAAFLGPGAKVSTRLDHLSDPYQPRRYGMLCEVCTVQMIQPGKKCARSCGLRGSHAATWAGSCPIRSLAVLKESGIDDLDHHLSNACDVLVDGAPPQHLLYAGGAFIEGVSFVLCRQVTPQNGVQVCERASNTNEEPHTQYIIIFAVIFGPVRLKRFGLPGLTYSIEKPPNNISAPSHFLVSFCFQLDLRPGIIDVYTSHRPRLLVLVWFCVCIAFSKPLCLLGGSQGV